MQSFFSPKGRLSVSRWLAMTMNTLNVLSPALLLLAVFLLGAAKFGDHAIVMRQLLTQYAAILVAAGLITRVLWGVCIQKIKRRNAKPTGLDVETR
jgi:hypothetical protein